MGEDFKADHLQVMKDTNQHMEDFIIEVMSEARPKVGEGSLTGYMLPRDTGVSSLSSASVFIVK